MTARTGNVGIALLPEHIVDFILSLLHDDDLEELALSNGPFQKLARKRYVKAREHIYISSGWIDQVDEIRNARLDGSMYWMTEKEFTRYIEDFPEAKFFLRSAAQDFLKIVGIIDFDCVQKIEIFFSTHFPIDELPDYLELIRSLPFLVVIGLDIYSDFHEVYHDMEFPPNVVGIYTSHDRSDWCTSFDTLFVLSIQDGEFQGSNFPSNLVILHLGSMSNINSLALPSTLKELGLADVENLDISHLINLRSLVIKFTDLTGFDSWKFPVNIKSLQMKFCENINSCSKIHELIELVNFDIEGGSRGKPLLDIKFPKTLLKLRIRGYEVKEGFVFPPRLKSLSLESAGILQNVQFPENLIELDIFSTRFLNLPEDNNPIYPFSQKRLLKLSFGYAPGSFLLGINDNLKDLKINCSNIQVLDQIERFKSLECLTVEGSSTGQFTRKLFHELNFPPRLKELNLLVMQSSDNDFETYPEDYSCVEDDMKFVIDYRFKLPSELKRIHIRGHGLAIGSGYEFPIGLRALGLRELAILDKLITFDYMTDLRKLDLYGTNIELLDESKYPKSLDELIVSSKQFVSLTNTQYEEIGPLFWFLEIEKGNILIRALHMIPCDY